MAIPDALSRMHMAAYCSQTMNDTEVKLLGSLFSKAMENEDNPRASLESQEKVLQEIISHGKYCVPPFEVGKKSDGLWFLGTHPSLNSHISSTRR